MAQLRYALYSFWLTIFSLKTACNTDFPNSDLDTRDKQSLVCKPELQSALERLRLSRARVKFFIKRQLHKM